MGPLRALGSLLSFSSGCVSSSHVAGGHVFRGYLVIGTPVYIHNFFVFEGWLQVTAL